MTSSIAKKYISLIFLLALSFFAAGQEYEMQKSGGSKIYLSISTSYSASLATIQKTTWKETSALALIDLKKNVIEVYSLENGELMETIPYFKDGPNRVGNSITTFHIYAYDSILVLDSGGLGLSLINNKGEKLNSYKNADAELLGNPVHYAHYMSQGIQSANGKVYISGVRVYRSFYDDKGKLLNSIDMKTGKEDHLFRRPEFYERVFYANLASTLPRFAINGDSFIIGTASSNYIQVNEKDKPAKYYLAKSADIDTIMPYSTKLPTYIDPNVMAEKSVLNGTYLSVIYDPYRNFYYRIARIPPTKDQWLSTKRRIGKMTIIILNENFQKVGETELDYKKYDWNGFFISKEGLNFANLDKYRENEDELVFDAFVPVRR